MNIVHTQFGFNNANLLGLLKERGQALLSANFKEVKTIEDKLTIEKNKNFKQIRSPCFMVTTFNNQEGFNKLLELKWITILGQKLKFKRARMPTNMIWENREVSKRTRNCRIMLAFVYMMIFGCIYYIIAKNGMVL